MATFGSDWDEAVRRSDDRDLQRAREEIARVQEELRQSRLDAQELATFAYYAVAGGHYKMSASEASAFQRVRGRPPPTPR